MGKKCGRIYAQRRRTLCSHRAARGEYRLIRYIWTGRGIRSIMFLRTEFLRAYFFCLKYGGVIISSAKDLLVNEEIKLKEVRVVGVDGEAIGIMSSEDALAMAYDKGYDLVLMAPQAQPPVCRIMDYGKFRYEKEKKEKDIKKNKPIEMKEIQLSCRIDTHDFDTKARHAQKFLESGNKVRVVMRFKGREMTHIAIGQELMQKFIDVCSEVGTVDKAPVLDGRILSMVINPIKQK